MSTKYEKFVKHRKKSTDVDKAIALLNWDQETQLPKGAAELRGQQIATLSGISYEMYIDEDYVKNLRALNEESGLNPRQKKNVEHANHALDRSLKLNKEFIEQHSRLSSLAFGKWIEARKSDDFSIYAPVLKQLVELKREQAEMIGYDDHPYDALIDEFEPGARTKDLMTLFSDVRDQLVDFVKEIDEKQQVSDAWLYKNYDKDDQWNYTIELLKKIGYNFDNGRQDISAHPFTIDFGASDVRVTTRLNEKDMQESIFGTLHEGGHALYEQGLRIADYGMPTGSAISLGIHESQSRLYENNLGRGLPFWEANYADLQKVFPDNLGNVNLMDFYKSINLVKPSLIRTSADELTYHFHILIRFVIEQALISGEIEVEDIPAEWNKRYKEYLGIDVPNNAQGCLQDVHWAHGAFGYFPTYSLGSFYAAQFFGQAEKDIPNLKSEIASGNNALLLTWLRDNIHDHGRLYGAEELCKKITGEGLNFKHFMDYARDKYAHIYDLQSMEGLIA